MTTPETAAPEVVKPEAADRKTRGAAPPKSPVADPEAPYGWMTDPKTGEKRPKKRPGRQSKTVPPPRERPANTTRGKAAPPKSRDYTGPVSELTEAMWMIMASVPVIDTKVAGVNLKIAAVKTKAQAAILKDNAAGVVQGVTIMAQHNTAVAGGLDKLTSESGPAWILPAMFALVPFVAQSAAMWRAPVAGDVEKLAKRTEAEWDQMIHGAMADAAAEAEATAQAHARFEAQDKAATNGSAG